MGWISKSWSRSRFSFSAAAVPRSATLGAATVALCVLLLPDQASAFCRQSTCKEDSEAGVFCKLGPDGCIDGTPGILHRDSACLTFGVDSGSAAELGMTDAEFEDVVAEAFDRWMTVDCGEGKHPNLMVQSVGAVEVAGNFFCKSEPEANLAVWTMLSPWPTSCASGDKDCRALDPKALGYTSSIFDKSKNVGLVFDSDVELNVDRIKDEMFFTGRVRDVVLTVVTHEAGHFLGLAHSQHDDAVMAASYNNQELLGRGLTQDDIDGICSIYPPAKAKLECSEAGYVDGALNATACKAAASARAEDAGGGACAVSQLGRKTEGPSSESWLIPAGLGLWFLRRRRSA
jgi:Matrixin